MTVCHNNIIIHAGLAAGWVKSR